MSIDIDVRSLLSFADTVRDVEDDWELESLEFEHERRPLRGAVHFRVRLSRARSGLLAEVVVTATVELVCSRCLREYEQPVTAEFSEVAALHGAVAEEGAEGGLEVSEAGTLDLEPLLYEALVLGIPMKPLCGPECAGICPTCGADLNTGPCGCAPEAVDPRLEILKKLKESR